MAIICYATNVERLISMTSEEMADQVSACVNSLRSRIIGTGDAQYSRGKEQAIELKSNAQILRETLEEIDDGIVYLAVLRARLDNLLNKLT